MLSFIPKLSSPMVKAIRTSEGIFIAVLGVATAVTSAIDPRTLSHQEAGILLTIQGGALLAQRGLIKIIALQKGVGIGGPQAPVAVTAVAESLQQHASAMHEIASKLQGMNLGSVSEDLHHVTASLQGVEAAPPPSAAEEQSIQPPGAAVPVVRSESAVPAGPVIP